MAELIHGSLRGTFCNIPTEDKEINHHHHLANVELDHLLTHSGLHLVVYLMVSPGVFCLLFIYGNL